MVLEKATTCLACMAVQQTYVLILDQMTVIFAAHRGRTYLEVLLYAEVKSKSIASHIA